MLRVSSAKVDSSSVDATDVTADGPFVVVVVVVVSAAVCDDVGMSDVGKFMKVLI